MNWMSDQTGAFKVSIRGVVQGTYFVSSIASIVSLGYLSHLSLLQHILIFIGPGSKMEDIL